MTRWYGDPWPAADRRAPVCEDDADRVVTPVGVPCIVCQVKVELGDRGVLIPYWAGPGTEPGECAYHLRCFLLTTIGPGLLAEVEKEWG